MVGVKLNSSSLSRSGQRVSGEMHCALDSDTPILMRLAGNAVRAKMILHKCTCSDM